VDRPSRSGSQETGREVTREPAESSSDMFAIHRGWMNRLRKPFLEWPLPVIFV